MELGDHWSFIQDGASVHPLKHTKESLSGDGVEVLPCTSKSPDLNI